MVVMKLRLLESLLQPCTRLGQAAIVTLALMGGANIAHAADNTADAASDDDDADTAPAKPAAKTAAPPVEPAPPPPQSSEAAPGIVERLPPSAFSAPVVRGLHGGSLWLNAQGMQWPYYPRTGIGVSGYAWLDTDYEQVKIGAPNDANVKEVLQEGRFLLRITPTYSRGDWFVQGQAELVAKKDQTQPPAAADADDVWLRAGKWQKFDLTVGRFEAFEVYHLGMGLDLNTQERNGAFDSNNPTPTPLYGATYLFYRPSGAGNVAFHAYPTDNLRLELLGQVGNDGGFNDVGTRPAAIFDLGMLKLKAAAEYQLVTDRREGHQAKKEKRGVGGSAQLVFDPYVEFGANGGYALIDVFDDVGNQDTLASNTTKSFGGFLNARIVPDLLFGVGANDVHVSDQHLDVTTGKVGEFAHLQSFAALQYFWDSVLMVKLVVAYAKADFNPTFAGSPVYSNTMYSGRLRFEFLF